MAKLRVYQLASQYEIPSREFVQILNRYNIPVKNHMSALTDQQVEEFKASFDPNKDRRVEEQVPQKKKSSSSKATKKKASSQSSKQTTKTEDKQPTAEKTNKAKASNESKTQDKPEPQKKKNKKSANPRPTNKAEDHLNNNANNRNKKNRKKKSKKSNHEETIKVKDHSKKGKVSHSVYKKKKDEKKSEQAKNKVYEIPESLTVGELADTVGANATDIIKTLMMAGTMATINQTIDADTAQLVCDELGYEVKVIKDEDVFEKTGFADIAIHVKPGKRWIAVEGVKA